MNKSDQTILSLQLLCGTRWVMENGKTFQGGKTKKGKRIHLQWVPSHVNIAGNKIADSLAKDGAAQSTMKSASLTYLELHSPYINNKQSTIPSAHRWYEAKRPGVCVWFSFLSMQQSGTNYEEWPPPNFDF
ncbi:RNase H domain-containing protein [Trichonephila clavipes]|nr:RNase H domain-containing protein [Trichonephila clavipes]